MKFGAAAVQNSFGKGFIFTKLEDAIKKAGITADFIVEKASSPTI